MGIRQVTLTPRRGAEPGRVVARRVSRPQCATAAVGCTAVPARALVPRRVWQDRGARVGSTGGILQKVKQNRSACVSLSDKVASY